MDPTIAPDIASQPDTVETVYALLIGAASLVTGVAGTVMAFLKLGLKPNNGSTVPEVKALPVPDGWNDLKTKVNNLVTKQDALGPKIEQMARQVDKLSLSHVDQDRLVSELHSALLSPAKEVERLMMMQELKDRKEQIKVLSGELSTVSKGVTSTAESVDIMARKLKELSQ
jgi:hypothetical protein